MYGFSFILAAVINGTAPMKAWPLRPFASSKGLHFESPSEGLDAPVARCNNKPAGAPTINALRDFCAHSPAEDPLNSRYVPRRIGGVMKKSPGTFRTFDRSSVASILTLS